jgi:hypothetical protein
MVVAPSLLQQLESVSAAAMSILETREECGTWRGAIEQPAIR